ncbi:MAG: SDR family oxidoreductase, partial [Chthoniobacterales bacterium]
QSKADDLKKRGAAIVKGDLRDPESLEFALRGVTTVVSATHSMLGKGESSSDLVDDEGMRALVDNAKLAGVANFIFISVFGASLDHPIDFWRTKARIERYVRESGMAYTIIRPTAFMEMHVQELMGKFVLKGKRVLLFGAGRNPRNFVAAGDVAELVVRAVDDFSMRGEVIDIGGPENLTDRQAVAAFERASGKKAKVSGIPLSVLRVAALALGKIHPGVSRIIRSGIVFETTDQMFDPGPLLARTSLPLTRLDDFAREKSQAASSELSKG